MIEWKRIFDMHNGTIKPNQTIEVQKLTRDRVTIEEYKEYLIKTGKAIKASIDPTQYIRETRTKRDFY